MKGKSVFETHAHVKRITVDDFNEVKNLAGDGSFVHLKLTFHPERAGYDQKDHIELYFQDIGYARRLKAKIEDAELPPVLNFTVAPGE